MSLVLVWTPHHLTAGVLCAAAQNRGIPNGLQSPPAHLRCLPLTANFHPGTASPGWPCLLSREATTHSFPLIAWEPSFCLDTTDSPFNPWTQEGALSRGVRENLTHDVSTFGITSSSHFSFVPTWEFLQPFPRPGGLYCREACEVVWAEVIEYDSCFTDRETESRNLMAHAWVAVVNVRNIQTCKNFWVYLSQTEDNQWEAKSQKIEKMSVLPLILDIRTSIVARCKRVTWNPLVIDWGGRRKPRRQLEALGLDKK